MSFVIIAIMFILPIHISTKVNTEYYSYSKGTHLSWILIGIIPPIISLIGYSFIVIEENEISIANNIGIISTCIAVFFWIIYVLTYFEIIRFVFSYQIALVIGIIALFIWFGMLFDRIRYLSFKMKEKMEPNKIGT
jgi:threonine/homoserine efflux transporter RhtA